MATKKKPAAKAAKPETAAPESNITGGKYKRVKALTGAVIQFAVGVARVLRIDTPMEISTRKEKAGAKKMEPATVCQVTDIETGETGTMICAKVIRSSLEEGYPNGGYVGKAFEITKGDKKKSGDGFMYSPFAVYEVDPDQALDGAE